MYICIYVSIADMNRIFRCFEYNFNSYESRNSYCIFDNLLFSTVLREISSS